MKRGTYELTILDRRYRMFIGDTPKRGGIGGVDFAKREIYIDADCDDVDCTINHEIFETICVQLGLVVKDYDGTMRLIMSHTQMDIAIMVLTDARKTIRPMRT